MKNFYLVTEIDGRIVDDSRDSTGEHMTEAEAMEWLAAFTVDGVIRDNGVVSHVYARQDA